MMINGAVGGVRTLIWSYLLLTLPIYCVALFLRHTVGQEEDATSLECCSTTPRALWTSFRCLVSGDCITSNGKPIFVLLSMAHGPQYAMFFCITKVFFMFGLFNVIVAIYVENTVAAAKFNEVRQKRNRLRDQSVFTD